MSTSTQKKDWIPTDENIKSMERQEPTQKQIQLLSRLAETTGLDVDIDPWTRMQCSIEINKLIQIEKTAKAEKISHREAECLLVDEALDLLHLETIDGQ